MTAAERRERLDNARKALLKTDTKYVKGEPVTDFIQNPKLIKEYNEAYIDYFGDTYVPYKEDNK